MPHLKVISYTLLLVLNLYPVALAGPGDEKTITMEGRAAGANANAMEQAKQDALRRAVEQTCGTFINAQTKTKNYAAVYDKVLSQAVGYVSEFEVLDQRVEAGVSHCKLRATVSTKSFELEWARLAHTIQAEDNPRCVVIVVEDNDADDDVKPHTDGAAQSTLEKFLMSKGLQLMDQNAADATRGRDLALAAMNNDINRQASVAASFKADVLIRGNAEARRAGSSEVAGRTVYRWNATINIKAYHTDSAQVLMSGTYSATNTTLNDNAGGDDALRKCAEQNAPTILRDIGEAWRKRQNVHRTCQLTIENCSRRDYKAFEEILRRVDGVQNVRLRELVNNTCQVEVDWSYDVERLAARIESLKVSGAACEITEQTHDRLTVKLVRK